MNTYCPNKNSEIQWIFSYNSYSETKKKRKTLNIHVPVAGAIQKLSEI